MALNNISSTANSPNVTATNVNNATANDTLNSSAISSAGITTSTPTSQTAAQNDNLVVRIDENSADNLQALFDMALNQKARPLQVPFRMRNLPDSFFNPPSTGSKSPSVSHTRENSVDSAFGSGTTTICSPNGNNANNNATGATKLNGNTTNATTAIINPLTSRLQISHSRAHSSPASLQQTYAGLNAAQTNANPIVAQQVRGSELNIFLNYNSNQNAYILLLLRLHGNHKRNHRPFHHSAIVSRAESPAIASASWNVPYEYLFMPFYAALWMGALNLIPIESIQCCLFNRKSAIRYTR